MQNFDEDNSEKFYGMYRALIENNGYDLDINGDPPVEDPNGQGRVQVRVLGLHSQVNEDNLQDGIPTENLPWAEQAGSLFGGFGSKGAGLSLIPEVGAWVWIWFDTGNHRKPVYFASVVAKGDINPKIVSAGSLVLNFPGGTEVVVAETFKENGDLKSSKIDITGADGVSGVLITYDPSATPKTEATLSAEVIRLSSNDIRLGSGSGYVLTSSLSDPISVGNITLLPATGVKA